MFRRQHGNKKIYEDSAGDCEEFCIRVGGKAMVTEPVCMQKPTRPVREKG